MLMGPCSSTVRGQNSKLVSATLTATTGSATNYSVSSHSNPNNWYVAEYYTFRVLSEAKNYRLMVAGYSGNAGSFNALAYHNSMMFTTYDRDNDQQPTNQCANNAGGGFWHKACTRAEVNSVYDGIHPTHDFSWRGLPGGKRLKTSRMWLQCK